MINGIHEGNCKGKHIYIYVCVTILNIYAKISDKDKLLKI